MHKKLLQPLKNLVMGVILNQQFQEECQIIFDPKATSSTDLGTLSSKDRRGVHFSLGASYLPSNDLDDVNRTFMNMIQKNYFNSNEIELLPHPKFPDTKTYCLGFIDKIFILNSILTQNQFLYNRNKLPWWYLLFKITGDKYSSSSITITIVEDRKVGKINLHTTHSGETDKIMFDAANSKEKFKNIETESEDDDDDDENFT